MERKALIDDAGRVENVIVYSADFDPPKGLELVGLDGASVSPGDAYDGTDWHQRPSVPDGAPDGSTVEWTGDEFVTRQPDGSTYS
jgi:hypothetical protein